MSYFENNQKKIIFFTFLIICICCCCFILPKRLGFTKDPEIDLKNKSLKEFIFTYEEELDFKNNDDAINKFKKLKKIVLKDLDIFDNNYTSVKFSGDHLKEDLLVAITTYLNFGFYATSYERVSTIIDEENYFRLVLSACFENVIDGYYVIVGYLKDSKIKIKYKKVESLNNLFMKIVMNEKEYKKMNNKSVKNTVVKLFNLLNKN
jgi:hypothetical protein